MSRINRCFNRIRNNNRRLKKNDNKILEAKEREKMLENVLKELKKQTDLFSSKKSILRKIR